MPIEQSSSSPWQTYCWHDFDIDIYIRATKDPLVHIYNKYSMDPKDAPTGKIYDMVFIWIANYKNSIGLSDFLEYILTNENTKSHMY